MDGPIQATIRPGVAPRATMEATTACATPDFAPFHPACAAPITPAALSARRMGAQSAVKMPRANPTCEVTRASRAGRRLATPSLPDLGDGNPMDLVDSQQRVRGNPQPIGASPPVFRNMQRVVGRSEPAVQRTINAAAHFRPAGRKSRAGFRVRQAPPIQSCEPMPQAYKFSLSIR